MSKVAAGFEIEAPGALELALFFVKRHPTVWTGSFDLLEIQGFTCADRLAVCHLAVPCRSTRQDGQGSWPHRQAGPQRL